MPELIDATMAQCARQALRQTTETSGLISLIPERASRLRKALSLVRQDGCEDQAFYALIWYASTADDPLGYIPPAAYTAAVAVRYAMAAIDREPRSPPPQTCPEW